MFFINVLQFFQINKKHVGELFLFQGQN